MGEPLVETKKDDKAEEKVVVAQSTNPSHILGDGRFIFLPPPNLFEKARFFERSIAKYGLLQKDLTETTNMADDQAEAAAAAPTVATPSEDTEANEGDGNRKKEEEQPFVHPLAVASARVQASGISELNRAINLLTLVHSGQYFGLTNIVDPSLEIGVKGTKPDPSKDSSTAAAAAAAETTPTTSAPGGGGSTGGASSGERPDSGGGGPTTTGVSATKSASEKEMQQEQRIKASYILKRKRAQFEKASRVLQRHERRLAASILAQSIPDKRMRQLRPQWRLVAPEHGTRAKPHPVRPTELVAVDVDVYEHDSHQQQQQTSSSSTAGTIIGRLASRVPRYATIELRDDYKVQEDLQEWTTNPPTSRKKLKPQKQHCTRAEPFAFADPTLGKVDLDFDPNKVTMLTLQFDIEKPSTGFCISSRLEPMMATFTSSSSPSSSANDGSAREDDETVLVALQRSLFCAKLFESIQRELTLHTYTNEQEQRQQQQQQSVAWMYSVDEENFLPAPSLMAWGDTSQLASLCVNHCHEGEVKVQLDSEYTFRAKLVETDDYEDMLPTKDSNETKNSGSQTPKQLQLLCRSLLLHAQDEYHKYSIRMQRKKKAETKTKQQQKPKGLERVVKQNAMELPRILQSCVSLGTKMLFEDRIRKTIRRVQKWLKISYPETKEMIHIDWLCLSLFDLHSQFSLRFCSWLIDVDIIRDEMTVMSFGETGEYRKVKFSSDSEFEIFLKMQIRQQLRPTNNHHATPSTNGAPAAATTMNPDTIQILQ